MDVSGLSPDVASWLAPALERKKAALQQAQGQAGKQKFLAEVVDTACSSGQKSARAAAESALTDIAPLLFFKEMFLPNPQRDEDKKENLENLGYESAEAFLKAACDEKANPLSTGCWQLPSTTCWSRHFHRSRGCTQQTGTQQACGDCLTRSRRRSMQTSCAWPRSSRATLPSSPIRTWFS